MRKATARAMVEFAIDAQSLYADLPEAEAAATAYRAAEMAAEQLKRQVGRLRLTPAFPLGTTCDLCRDLIPSA